MVKKKIIKNKKLVLKKKVDFEYDKDMNWILYIGGIMHYVWLLAVDKIFAFVVLGFFVFIYAAVLLADYMCADRLYKEK